MALEQTQLARIKLYHFACVYDHFEIYVVTIAHYFRDCLEIKFLCATPSTFRIIKPSRYYA
jgi:hypothetical protein